MVLNLMFSWAFVVPPETQRNAVLIRGSVLKLHILLCNLVTCSAMSLYTVSTQASAGGWRLRWPYRQQNL